MIDINSLVSALGYLRFEEHWITPERVDARLSQHYQLAQRAGEQAGEGASVIGSYTYATSFNDKLAPARSAVFVAQATNEEQAREIHKRLWNLGDCPFAIIVLPGVVRVYTGFDYDSKDAKRGRITSVVMRSDALPDPLKPFNADAVNNGSIWEEQAKYLGSDTRVDYRLLKNLKELSSKLQDIFDLSREVAHALIGKYIYFRYLRDRGILDDDWLSTHDIKSADVFTNEATAEGFAALAVALQNRFNGDIFPLPIPDDERWKANGAIPFLVGVFNGNEVHGQLALDFQVYDFSFIPVELLSSIYEVFLKSEGKGEGDGVVYTPEALADYVLSEIEAVHPLRLGHKIIDPCCGSGIFLVLAYRRLILKLWERENTRPSADALKDLLIDSIFGVEKDREACHITSFSLILTLLSHLEPPELHANAAFQFPALVGTNIHHSDFFVMGCPVFRESCRFDWLVGNPPWSQADRRISSHKPALEWMNEAAKEGRVVGERRLDESFTWRASDLLKPDGFAALLIKATALVNPSSSEYRKAFFKVHTVRRVTNFSNLRRLLFIGPGGKMAEAPAACLVYKNTDPEEHKPPIFHFGPFVANQLPIRTKGGRRRVWTIALYESDIQEIDPDEAESDVDCLWKSALWGSFQDRRALLRLSQIMPTTLGDYLAKPSWLFSKGLEFYRGRAESLEKFVEAPELEGQGYFVEKLSGRFNVNDAAITLLTPSQYRVRGRSGLNLLSAPHLVLTSEGAVYSDNDFVIPSPKIGISVPKSDAHLLKAVAFYLNSSIARYLQFFYNAPSGIYIFTSTKETIGQVPFIDLSEEQTFILSSAYNRLAEQERNKTSEFFSLQPDSFDLQDDIDAVVESALNIPESVCSVAREFMQVKFQLNEGKVNGTASETPSMEALKRYAERMRRHVNDFTRRQNKVSIQVGPEAIIATVEATAEKDLLPVSITTQWNKAAHDLINIAQEQHSQWAYICRSIRVFDGPRVHIIKASRLLDWTQTQAIQDASDLISEVLAKTATNYEPKGS